MRIVNKRNAAWLLLAITGYAVLFTLVNTGLLNRTYQITLVKMMLDIIFAVGLNLVLGVAGQFSLGHAGFIALGAYSGAIITSALPGLHGLLLGMLVGSVLAVIVAILVGIPTLRLKGDYLAIATLGVAEIIRVVINNLKDITKGTAGISGIPRIVDWSLVYIFLVITTIITLNYVYSSAGRATLAVQYDEIAAESMGVNITKYKVMAFALGAITASIGGVLHAGNLGVIQPADFGFVKSIDILIIVVFGGIGSFTGTFIAAIVLGLLNLLLQPYGELRMVMYAVALIFIMVFRPSGLLGTKEFRFGKLVDHTLFKKKGAK